MRTDFKQLPEVVKEYLDNLALNYISDEEKQFFETVRYRQQYVFTYANDLLMSDHDNEDGIYIVRSYFDEYEIGRYDKENFIRSVYAMNIDEAMAINIEVLGCSESMTLLDWLRKRNYQGINYNHNFDNL